MESTSAGSVALELGIFTSEPEQLLRATVPSKEGVARTPVAEGEAEVPLAAAGAAETPVSAAAPRRAAARELARGLFMVGKSSLGTEGLFG
ncbi:hypothetical protein TPA0909_09500 [Streptomyces albus]|nr:hypothetical protein TPA0909_09500 [Streptomyces albus]